MLEAIAQGVTRSQAMVSVGLTPQTLSATMKRDLTFAAQVEEAEMPKHGPAKRRGEMSDGSLGV